MAEDRALLSPEEAIAALQAELADFKSTANSRLARLPTGTTLPTFATTAPPGTLLLIGQVVPRDECPDLWAWTEATSAGGFVRTATTLQLPDARGRVLRGVAAAGETVGQQVGADSRTLTVANLPSHDHSVSVGSGGSHGHDGSTSTDGGHLGHSPFGSLLVPQGDHFGVPPWNHGGTNLGNHNHDVSISSAGSHTHSVTEQAVGSGQALDLRQAALAVNHLIWC